MRRIDLSDGLVKRLEQYQDAQGEPVELTVQRVLDLLEEDLWRPPRRSVLRGWTHLGRGRR